MGILLAAFLGRIVKGRIKGKDQAVSIGVKVSIAVAGAFGLAIGIPVGDVNACVNLRRNKFDPPLFSTFSYSQLITSKVHAHVCTATQQMDAATPPCGRASPPGHAVVDGWRRDERTRDILQNLPRSLVSSAKPTTGVQVVRPAAPPMPRLAHSRCQQSRAAPPQTTAVRNADVPCASLLVTTSFPSKCGFATIFHAVTGTRNGNDLRMMKQPVKQRGRKDLIAQETAPVGKAGIRGQ
jgi:hypothetical protein